MTGLSVLSSRSIHQSGISSVISAILSSQSILLLFHALTICGTHIIRGTQSFAQWPCVQTLHFSFILLFVSWIVQYTSPTSNSRIIEHTVNMHESVVSRFVSHHHCSSSLFLPLRNAGTQSLQTGLLSVPSPARSESCQVCVCVCALVYVCVCACICLCLFLGELS